MSSAGALRPHRPPSRRSHGGRGPSASLGVCAALGLVLASGCRGSDGHADAGGPPPPRSLLDHVLRRAEAMPDARFRAQLLADLGAGAFGRSPEVGRPLLEQSVVLARAVKAQEDRDLALEFVILAHARAGLFTEGAPLLAELRSPERRARSGVAFAKALAERRDFERAEATAAAIADPALKSEAYAELGCALAHFGDLARAATVGRKVMTPEDADRVLSSIAIEHAKRRAYATAEDALEQIAQPRWKGEAEAAFALEYARRGMTKRVEEKLQVIESAPVRARAHFLVARVWHTQGRRAKASGLGARARTLAEQIGDPLIRAAAVEELARLMLEDGAVKEAQAFAAKAGSQEVEHRVVAWVVAKHASEGRLAEAAREARTIATDPLSGADALGALAVAQAEAGQLGAALATLAEIQNPQLRLPHLARAVFATGDAPPPESALAALERVLR